jgi:tripartite-type tricarboxylate transporter receptor subunit TctC
MRRLGLLAATLLLALFSNLAHAQDYPAKPITLIVPFPAGGATDVLMRAMSEVASKQLGQPVIVENKAGGGGAIGPGTMAMTAKPDGYTISQIPIPVYRLPMMQKAQWSHKDFSYIIHLTGYTFMLCANGETGFKNWKDVVDHAKANPGKITYGTSGAGGTPHLGTEMISEKAGIKMTHVPFKGDAEATAALLGNHVMLIVCGPGHKPHVEAGKAAFLNIWTANRAPQAPDIPTLKELGIPYVIDSSFGIAGPKNMDPKIVSKLHDAFKVAMESPSVLEVMNRYQMVPNYKNTADYTRYIDDQVKFEGDLLKRLGLYRAE